MQIPAINPNQAVLDADSASQQATEMDYRRSTLMADNYRPISGKMGQQEELAAGHRKTMSYHLQVNALIKT